MTPAQRQNQAGSAASTVERGTNLQPTINALAKHIGWWNEDTQSPEYEHAPWNPDSNSDHCGLLASHLGIRYRSNTESVHAYIGDAPVLATGAIVATVHIEGGDKAAAGRMATIACALLYLQTPEKYRPAQAPAAQEAAPSQAVGKRARIEAALARFTPQDIATAMDVLTAIHQAKTSE